MKIKLVVAALFLAGFQYINAQEIKSTIVDSVKVKALELEKQNVADKKALDQKLKNDKNLLKEQERIAKEQKNAEKKLKKEQDKLKKEQKKFEKEQSQLASAEKSLAKNKEKLTKANKDLVKLKEKQAKAVKKGKLSAVDIEKGNLKVTQQQIKVKEIEEDIDKSQKKLDKLR